MTDTDTAASRLVYTSPAPVRRHAPFAAVPDDLAIARHFWDQTEHHNDGCDGIDLFRDGRDYCYLWVEAMVDLDMWHAYLLEIRTHVNVPADTMGETRDYLFVFVGAGNRFEVARHGQPEKFDAPAEVHQARFRAGMVWFTSCIEQAVAAADSGTQFAFGELPDSGAARPPSIRSMLEDLETHADQPAAVRAAVADLRQVLGLPDRRR